MRGLASPPTLAQLEQAYSEIQSESQAVNEQTLALWTQWGRFDPRLAELLAAFLARKWHYWDALALNFHLSREPWPAALGVIAEHAHFTLPHSERPVFKAWAQLALAGVPKACNELFFIGTMKFGGPRMRREAQSATRPYLRWGYLGHDPLINKATRRETTTLMSPQRRSTVLEDLLQRQRTITVNDYLEAMGGNVSRRVAQKDLEHHPRLKRRGETKGRVYFR